MCDEMTKDELWNQEARELGLTSSEEASLRQAIAEQEEKSE